MRFGAPIARATRRFEGTLHLCAGGLFALGVASPALFTDRTYSTEFTNNIWFIYQRAAAVDAGNWLSPFVHTPPTGVFAPMFAFYGGSVFTALGAIADVLGHRVLLTFALTMYAAFAAAYGGLFWLARLFGLSRRLAHLPAICVLTSAYWITVGYGRGDLPELLGLCAACLLASASLSTVLRGEWRVGPAVAVILSAAVFAGAHNITALWATSLMVFLVGGTVAVLRLRAPIRRLVRLAALALLGVGLDAWTILPNLAWAKTTVISHLQAPLLSSETAFFDTAAVLFYPLRSVPRQSGTPALFVQAPDAFFVVAAIALVLLARGPGARPVRRVTVVVALAAAGVLTLILTSATWRLPFPWSEIQFPYRLNSYLALLVAGLVILSLLAVPPTPEGDRRLPRVFAVALVVASSWSIAIAAWQLWIPNDHQVSTNPTGPDSLATRSDALASLAIPPKSFYTKNDYADATGTPINLEPNRALTIDPGQLDAGQSSVAVVLPVPPGRAPIDTDIGTDNSFVTVSGALRVVGRDTTGNDVVVRTGALAGPVLVQVAEAVNFELVAGRLITEASAAAALAFVVSLTVWRTVARRRTGVTSAPPPDHARTD